MKVRVKHSRLTAPVIPALIVVAMVQCSVSYAVADVLITEFLAINDSTLADVDDDYPDWIEIHNPAPTAVDLTGWYLTDDATDLTKWRFPTTTIDPGGYLVVFASDKDRAVAGAELHTSFKLGGDGEYLGLVQSDGVTVAHAYAPAYPAQSEDVSYGLAGAAVTETLVDRASPARAWVPDTDVGLNWTGGQPFDDGGWIDGVCAIGYDTGANFEPYFDVDLEAAMLNQTGSAYMRISFPVSDPASIAAMTLRMRYDDGFIAYLNGVEIARRNAPDSPTYESLASTYHPEALTTVFEDIDVAAFTDALIPGTNILALHGMNFEIGSSDFLISPELTAAVMTAGAGAERFFTEPTPGSANGVGTLGQVADTKFSVDRGFYVDPFDVAITTATAGATIHYTTDGTTPTETHGERYVVPLAISTTTTLRAMAFANGYESTNVDTQTYVFAAAVIRQDGIGLPDTWGHAGADYVMDPDVVDDPVYAGRVEAALTALPTVSLVMDLDDWFATGGTGIYPAGEGDPRAVSMEWIDVAGADDFQVDASVEVQGGSSTARWRSDKLSLRLEFTAEYGPTKLSHDLFGPEATDRFDTLILDARFNLSWHYGGGLYPDDQHGWAQMTRDQFVADLQNASGGYAPHGRSVHVYLNGLYWGIYALHERPDESFCAEYLGGDKDDYDVIKHQAGTVVSGSNADYLEMLAVADAGLAAAAAYENLQQYLDVPNFIDYMLVNYYVGNTDWGFQNWYASRSRVDPGSRWRFHSWDAEHVMKAVTEDVTGFNDPGGPTGLHQALMSNAEYRLQFADHTQRLLFNGGPLSPEGAAAIYLARVSALDEAIVAESARWGDNRRQTPYTRDVEWVAERDRLLSEYFPQRAGIVLAQLRAAGLYPSIPAPVLQINGDNQHGGEIHAGDVLSIAAPAGVILYTLDGTDPWMVGGTLADDAHLLPVGGEIVLASDVVVAARLLFADQCSALIVATFTIVASPVPGDFDADGDVDLDDFIILKRSFATTGSATWATGDANGDGDVDLDDFAIFKLNFAGAAPVSPSP